MNCVIWAIRDSRESAASKHDRRTKMTIISFSNAGSFDQDFITTSAILSYKRSKRYKNALVNTQLC